MKVLIIILLLFGIADINCFMCHKCASTDAVWNWVKYGLPVSQGDSVVSDDKCLNETKLKKDGDGCSGYCMTINITRADGDYQGRTIAMVRDCHSNIRKLPEIDEGSAPMCTSREKHVNRRLVNITTCYCRGHYCNGVGSSDAFRRSKILQNPAESIVKSSDDDGLVLIHLFSTCCRRRKNTEDENFELGERE